MNKSTDCAWDVVLEIALLYLAIVGIATSVAYASAHWDRFTLIFIPSAIPGWTVKYFLVYPCSVGLMFKLVTMLMGHFSDERGNVRSRPFFGVVALICITILILNQMI